ncbi:MAG: hypothetical protein SFT91_04780, partial [Rickettsiaceae bacterium]|nr:hypothetical protein [Rickettsiaceae bacterium]
DSVEISANLRSDKLGYNGNAKIYKENRLKHNSYISAEIKYDIHKNISVPEEAVFIKGSKKYVYIINGENKAESLEIETGDRIEGKIEITNGSLSSGQKVIYEGVQKISDGSFVEIVN